ncbi:MAG: hypothetical protein KDD61_02685 [Bdellovibrionales bacterium]|nr:hypothetical protein [Bdellovibrionales bacterium]
MSEKNDDPILDSNEPINIDELEVRILMIVSNEKKFEGIGSFLTRRGWETTVVSNLGSAVKNIVMTKPDVVLISLNHPNKKLQALPTLLTQTFNTNCVIFGETIDAKTSMALRESKSRHKITGFVSGPSIHRAIKKILQDIYYPKDEKEIKKNLLKSGEISDTISIKGNTDDSDIELTQSADDQKQSNMITIKNAGSEFKKPTFSLGENENTDLLKRLQEQLLGDDEEEVNDSNQAISGLDENGEIRENRGADNIFESPSIEKQGKGLFQNEESFSDPKRANEETQEPIEVDPSERSLQKAGVQKRAGQEKKSSFSIEENEGPKNATQEALMQALKDHKKSNPFFNKEEEKQTNDGAIVQKGPNGTGFEFEQEDSQGQEYSATQKGQSSRKGIGPSSSVEETKELDAKEKSEKDKEKSSKKGRTLANYDLSERSGKKPNREEALTPEREGSNKGPQITGSVDNQKGDKEEETSSENQGLTKKREGSLSSNSDFNGKNSIEEKAFAQGNKDRERGAKEEIARAKKSNLLGKTEIDLADEENPKSSDIEEAFADTSDPNSKGEVEEEKSGGKPQIETAMDKIANVESLSEIDKNSSLYKEISEFHQAITKALENVVKRPKGQIKKLIKVSRVDVLVIESQNLSGYLIIAHSESQFDHSGFAEKYRSEITELLSEKIENIKIDDHFSFNLGNTDFLNFGERYGDHSIIVANDGSESGIIYLRLAQPLPEIKESFSQDKIRVTVKDFHPDVALTFKAYLHLKKNEKYYCYLNEGRKISRQQREKLLKFDHPVHIEKDDIVNYKTYYIKILLDELIESLRNNFKENGAA